jgi:hypothetical protein
LPVVSQAEEPGHFKVEDEPLAGGEPHQPDAQDAPYCGRLESDGEESCAGALQGDLGGDIEAVFAADEAARLTEGGLGEGDFDYSKRRSRLESSDLCADLRLCRHRFTCWALIVGCIEACWVPKLMEAVSG